MSHTGKAEAISSDEYGVFIWVVLQPKLKSYLMKLAFLFSAWKADRVSPYLTSWKGTFNLLGKSQKFSLLQQRELQGTIPSKLITHQGHGNKVTVSLAGFWIGHSQSVKILVLIPSLKVHFFPLQLVKVGKRCGEQALCFFTHFKLEEFWFYSVLLIQFLPDPWRKLSLELSQSWVPALGLGCPTVGQGWGHRGNTNPRPAHPEWLKHRGNVHRVPFLWSMPAPRESCRGQRLQSRAHWDPFPGAGTGTNPACKAGPRWRTWRWLSCMGQWGASGTSGRLRKD